MKAIGIKRNLVGAALLVSGFGGVVQGAHAWSWPESVFSVTRPQSKPQSGVWRFKETGSTGSFSWGVKRNGYLELTYEQAMQRNWDHAHKINSMWCVREAIYEGAPAREPVGTLSRCASAPELVPGSQSVHSWVYTWKVDPQ